ncbi:MAG TPA: nitroreductase family deazaflavin-dependent oxidoreductase, partial [Anaerolineales bacterium]|nr:nitroreductase family deazaflavin-dependent oxidoreductase [Anaerolineales bacterium]
DLMTKKRSLYRQVVEAMASSKPGTWIILNVASRFDPFWLRVTRGRFSAGSLLGFPSLMLTTIGAKTGLPRSTALVFTRDGNGLVIVASRGGMDRHPGWYHNLKAHPEADVLLDGCSSTYTSYEATCEERERLWAMVCDRYSGYTTYQKRAGDRQIPIMVLTPQVGQNK